MRRLRTPTCAWMRDRARQGLRIALPIAEWVKFKSSLMQASERAVSERSYTSENDKRGLQRGVQKTQPKFAQQESPTHFCRGARPKSLWISHGLGFGILIARAQFLPVHPCIRVALLFFSGEECPALRWNRDLDKHPPNRCGPSSSSSYDPCPI